MNKIFRKLARLIIFAFVLIFLISNAIISLSYYNYFEKMMAAKLTQSVSTSSTAYIQSFFDTIKREALKLIEEEPLKGFLEGSAEPESTEDFPVSYTHLDVYKRQGQSGYPRRWCTG